MKFYSTNNPDLSVSFKEAVFNSMPADKGLYMPTNLPALPADFIQNIEKYSLQEIAFKVAETLLKDDISAKDLKAIINDSINFEAPIVALDKNTFVLELFHGPSLAFKDFGARFMSRIMAHFFVSGEKLLDVLVATSGDTGGAVALGFLGVNNTRVTILYPKGMVSPIQKLQLTTNQQNIRAIEVEGTFDDCQALVKQAFSDVELNQQLRLTSANSINIARLIPQMFYYFNTYAQLKIKGFEKVSFSVPSGNFGNICAGFLAYKMGLPVDKFVAATNINDTVPRFLKTGVYETKPSLSTYSNAMDVGAPSNWVRIMDLFGNDRTAILQKLVGYTFTDKQTLAAIETIFQQFNYVACPHTAIAWLGTQSVRHEGLEKDSASVFLSTAHACKFPDIFPTTIAEKIKIPHQVQSLEQKEQVFVNMKADFADFKQYLIENK